MKDTTRLGSNLRGGAAHQVGVNDVGAAEKTMRSIGWERFARHFIYKQGTPVEQRNYTALSWNELYEMESAIPQRKLPVPLTFSRACRKATETKLPLDVISSGRAIDDSTPEQLALLLAFDVKRDVHRAMSSLIAAFAWLPCAPLTLFGPLTLRARAVVRS